MVDTDDAGGIAGVVLTGGASRRMGRDKATLEVDGIAMARRVANALSAVSCTPILAVGGDSDRLRSLALPVLADRWPGEGPLGAIITALEHLCGPGFEKKLDGVVIAACDLPWLGVVTLSELVQTSLQHPESDVVVASTDRLEPLCAVWHRSALPIISMCFDAGERAVHAVLSQLVVLTCAVDPRSLVNVNGPDDLSRG